MSGLIGKKIGMTSLYDNDGKSVACTVLEAGPCFVSQIKTNDKGQENTNQKIKETNEIR